MAEKPSRNGLRYSLFFVGWVLFVGAGVALNKSHTVASAGVVVPAILAIVAIFCGEVLGRRR